MSFEQMIIYYGAPALCGLKSASLLSVTPKVFSNRKIAEWNTELLSLGKKIIPIKRSATSTLLFIYDEKVMYDTISGRKQISYLCKKNYPIGKGFNAVIKELFNRLSMQEIFPHEIGLFLGYPLEDVISFESDRGRSSKYSGMWQVYGNVEEAQKKMSIYRQCSVNCSRYFNMGMNFSYISKNYKAISNGGNAI